MPGIGGLHPGWGITVMRVLTGLILVVAGYQKFFVIGCPRA